MSRRSRHAQSPASWTEAAEPAADETIPDDFLASIPDIEGEGGEPAREVVVHAVFEEENPDAPAAVAAGQDLQRYVSSVIENLRDSMWSALYQEMDRAGAAFAASLSDYERQLREAQGKLVEAQAENAELRRVREAHERRLERFKALALGNEP